MTTFIIRTGVTFQADNQPTPTTILGAGVDVSVHPIIGLGGRMDWGKHTYSATGNGIDPRNGGIVGTVSYDTTRNELDPRYAAVEDWQPSISGLTVKLYAPVACPIPFLPDLRATHRAVIGSLPTAPLPRANSSTPTLPRPGNGRRAVWPAVSTVPRLRTGPTSRCCPSLQIGTRIASKAPLMGVQFGTYATDQGTPDANFGANVDGNFGFGDGCFNGTLDASDPANPRLLGVNLHPAARRTRLPGPGRNSR